MHTTRVDVPGVSDSVDVAGVTGDKLVLLGKVGCGGTTSLLTYDPAANTSTVLLGPPINGGGVTEARLFPDQKSCTLVKKETNVTPKLRHRNLLARWRARQ